MDLALKAGLSQRHISFLETGRSNPSRFCVFQIGDALEMPAAELDAMLLAAGFAARAQNPRWGAETQEAVNASIAHVLRGHEPYPAVAVDRIWNLQSANDAARRFFSMFEGARDPNLLREILKPGALRDSITNWQEVARALLRLLELELARRPHDEEAHALAADLSALPGVAAAASTRALAGPEPVLSIQFQIGEDVLRLFSLIATIGMSADATLDDLRIETLLPADQATRDWFSARF